MASEYEHLRELCIDDDERNSLYWTYLKELLKKYSNFVNKTSFFTYPSGRSFSTLLYSRFGSISFKTEIPKVSATASSTSNVGLILLGSRNEFT